MKERSVDVFLPGMVVHPILGMILLSLPFFVQFFSFLLPYFTIFCDLAHQD
jgi:hypothetical protein